MSDFVNIHEAKTHLSRLLARAEAGEEIVIARGGRPIARLVRYTPSRAPRKLGRWNGKIRIAPDFDQTPDLNELFEGGDE